MLLHKFIIEIFHKFITYNKLFYRIKTYYYVTIFILNLSNRKDLILILLSFNY